MKKRRKTPIAGRSKPRPKNNWTMPIIVYGVPLLIIIVTILSANLITDPVSMQETYTVTRDQLAGGVLLLLLATGIAFASLYSLFRKGHRKQ